MKGEKKSRQSNASLGKARAAKNDEFYTRWNSIEQEVWNYRDHFRGAVVYCNCDDPKVSNFYKYFKAKFGDFGLRCLITTCYKNQDAELFSKHNKESAVSVEYDGIKENIRFLRGDGDFQSAESVELLQKADIVCTNPPFSKFRPYIAQLAESGKKFLVIGNMNALSYKEIFRLIMAEKLWVGVTSFNTGMYFNVPDDFVYAPTYRFERERDGEKVNRVPGVCWFTNLPHKKRELPLILVERYSESAYPKCDNYDAIEVGKVADIPRDYAGVMGVPLTFLDKWNPEQFEIIWTADRGGDGMLEHLKKPHARYDAVVVQGIPKYKRIFIRNRNPE